MKQKIICENTFTENEKTIIVDFLNLTDCICDDIDCDSCPFLGDKKDCTVGALKVAMFRRRALTDINSSDDFEYTVKNYTTVKNERDP